MTRLEGAKEIVELYDNLAESGDTSATIQLQQLREIIINCFGSYTEFFRLARL